MISLWTSRSLLPLVFQDESSPSGASAALKRNHAPAEIAPSERIQILEERRDERENKRRESDGQLQLPVTSPPVRSFKPITKLQKKDKDARYHI